jgi:GWxTD domain-containing protein
MRAFFLFIFLICAVSGGPQIYAQETAFRVAVVPLKSTFNPDYGAFMADRIAIELYSHAHVAALNRDRFVLVETDTLSHDIQDQLHKIDRQTPPQLLEYLRRIIPANYLVTGSVSTTGIHHLDILFLDLGLGKIVWKGVVRDNPSWVWTHNREVGETPANEVRDQLGFGVGATWPQPLTAEALPKQVLLQPLFTTEYQALAADCEKRLRTTISQDGIFTLVPGSLKGSRGQVRFSRIGQTLRTQAIETTLTDAVLCGSLLTLGKDGGVDNIAIVLRLVDVKTGLVSWMGASNGRRVWRWDKLADIVSGVIAGITEDLAQFGAEAAETAMVELRGKAHDGSGWADLGEAYIRRGLLRQAEEAFNKTLTFPDGGARAQSGLGQIALRRGGDFDKVISSFRAAIKIDPDYLFAYCHLAQAYLDRDMSDGKQYVVEALRRDPSFSLAWRILGDWSLSREESKNARNAYQKYLALEPDDVEVATRLGRVLLRLKDYALIDRLIAPIQRAKPEAAELVPVVAIKNIRVKKYQEATRLFNRFLSQVNVRERSHYEDIQAVLPEREQERYASLSEQEQKVYRDRFWREKSPDLSNPYNARQLIHFSRIWVARQDFGKKIYPWDRRGAVYIRYGEPDYRSRSGWTPTLPSNRVQQVKERVYLELYTMPPEGELIGPVFPVRSSRGIGIAQEDEFEVAGQNQQDNSFNDGLNRNRTNEQFTNTSTQEAYAPVTLQNDQSIVPWESWVYVDVDGGLVFDFTKEMGGVSGYDFAPIPPILPTILKSTIRLAEFAPAISFQRALSNQADDFREPQVLPLEQIYYDIADFRGGPQRTRVDVSLAVPMENLLVVTDGQEPHVLLERAVALADSSYSVVYRQGKQIEFAADSEALGSGQIIDVLRQDVPPGTYHMTLTIKDVMSGRVGKLKRDVVIEAYDPKSLGLSDLMLVQSVTDTITDVRFRRGTWQVRPNPDRKYAHPRNLAFYCEVYNLEKNEFGQTHYRVTTAVKSVDERSGLRPSGPIDQPEVALSYEQVGNQPWERLPLEVDLTNAQPGPNRLVVVVEDLVSGLRVAKETSFAYIR